MEIVKCKCRECADKYEGCHSTCESYIKYTKYLEEKKRVIAEGKRKMYGEFIYHRKYQV